MQQSTALKIAFLFSVIGVLFSGYLTISKLLNTGCVISEGCPFLFGYPACAYGLAMYLVLAVASGYLLFMKPKDYKMPLNVLLAVSAIGVLFSLYFTIIEILNIATTHYTLLLPVCMYGLVMYLIVFASALILYKNRSK